MEGNTIANYVYAKFQADLEKLPIQHPHVIRREPMTTYRDEFALSQLMDISPELYAQSLEGWSRSYYLQDKHLEAVHAYAMQDIPMTNINYSLYKECSYDVRNRLSSLHCVRAYDVLSELDLVSYTASSAAGYDYRGSKGPLKGENHKRAIQRAKATMWSIYDEGIPALEHAIDTHVPDVGYTRTQLADLAEKTKIRSVWGRAFHYILLEGVVADPLLKAFSNANTFYHIGKDPIESVPRVLSDINSECKWIYALDWQKFDATVSRFEINEAFDIVKSIVEFPNYQTEICFEVSKHLFIHKKIAAPDGYIYWSHKGIPSGSYFTSLIGSIVNRLRIEYLWRTLAGHSPKQCYVQGDDSVLGDDKLIMPEKIAKIANRIGWYFNPDKTEFSTAPEFVTFLGRTFEGGLNKRDLIRCLRLLIFTEYPVESGRISAYRAISISEDAGGTSFLLNRIADRLKRIYGVALESEVPLYFKRYIHGM